MTEIRYATMADKELLLSKGSRIKENIWEESIKNKHEIIMFVDGNFAGRLRQFIPGRNSVYEYAIFS